MGKDHKVHKDVVIPPGAIPGGRGGWITPQKPGDKGLNPKGRTTLGAYVTECLNSLGQQQPSRDKLLKLIRDPKTASNMRIAAVRYLRMMEHADMADFEEVLDDGKKLSQLREEGIDTALVKKCKTRRRSYTENETQVVEVEREIELHDRSREEFETTLNRTDGQPKQKIDVATDDQTAAAIAKARKFLDDNG